MSDLSTAVTRTADAARSLVKGLDESLAARGWTLATAESLTGGTIATLLTAGPDSSTWFKGSIVAYDPEVKFGLLGVPRGPVVTEECATTMARSAARLLGADLCVAVTGVGGPQPDEGEPAGTVWLAVTTPDGVWTEKLVFAGDPVDVVATTTARAIGLLQEIAGSARPADVEAPDEGMSTSD